MPCLWFDEEAEAAATLYAQTFGGRVSALTRVQVDTPSGKPRGSVLTVEFEAGGRQFTALNGGPMFKPGPNISFFFHVKTPAEADRAWAALIDGGTAMMPLDTYPWSERYGWVQDRFGVSWQVMTDRAYQGETIVPCFMFAGRVHGRAEEAMRAWTAAFPGSAIERIERYPKGQGPEGTVMHGRFSLWAQPFIAMDAHGPHESTFTEGVSLQVRCADQRELDRFWDALVAGGAPSQCGWLKDRFGVSWQVIPANIGELLRSPSAFAALLTMQKLDIAALERA